jgi:hypothetical protein
VAGKLTISGTDAAPRLEIEAIGGAFFHIAPTAGAAREGLIAEKNVIFTGEGEVRFTQNNIIELNVSEGVSADFHARVDASTLTTANRGLRKTGKGSVLFTNTNANVFPTGTAITIRDGELGLIHPNQFNGLVGSVTFDDANRLDFNPVFTALWTGNQAIDPTANFAFTVAANTTRGTINVPNAGATLTLPNVGFTGAAGDQTIFKTGPGTLALDAAAAWASAVEALDIVAGTVVVNAGVPNGFQQDVNIEVGAGATFRLARNANQRVGEFTGTGTADLREGSELSIARGSEFPGYITGDGNVTILADVTISGLLNDYSGDTTVEDGLILTIAHEHNLGGTKAGRLYLIPGTGTGGVLSIAQGASFILPNELVLGNPDTNVGAGTIIVPLNSRLEIANDITYNQNILDKQGQGDLVLSSLGYGSTGNGSFDDNTGDISISVRIFNGRVRIENVKAADGGDIVVAPGAPGSWRPVLSIRNGLKLSNAIQFGNYSTFETELISANLAEGTDVQSAVEVGRVEGPGANGTVYNRVDFLQLPGGTITKGNDFQLLKSTAFRLYASENVQPVYTDSQTKAPFDPYFSNVYLYFKATSNIDVPSIGAPSITQVTPETDYRIELPVATTTSLKLGSETISTNLPGARVAIDGTKLVITGRSPALPTSGDLHFPYRVAVVTNDKVNDVLGYEGHLDNELIVTLTPNNEPPAAPTYTSRLNFTNASGTPLTTTSSTDLSKIAGSIVIANLATGNPAAGSLSATVSLYSDAEGASAIDSKTVTVTDGHATYEFLPAAPATEFAEGTYYVRLTAESYAPGEEAKLTYTLSKTSQTPDQNRGGSGGGGCDAGFGLLSLLAAGAAVALRRKG